MVARIRARTNEPLVRRNFSIFEGDYEKLQRIYPNVSISAVVRGLIRGLIKRNELIALRNQQPLNIEVPQNVLDQLLEDGPDNESSDGGEPKEP